MNGEAEHAQINDPSAAVDADLPDDASGAPNLNLAAAQAENFQLIN